MHARSSNTADLTELLRQQETLRAVVESISSELELRPLLTRIVRHACDLIGADNGTIGLVDEARGVVRTEAAWGMPADELGAEMPRGVGLAGQVLQTGKSILLQRYGEVDTPTQPGLLANAVIGVPIFWRERMTGVFGIGAVPPRRFEERDVETLTLFARHAAVAIENAHRYEWERRRTERFALLARIGRILTDGLRSPETLLQNAADAIHELLAYPNVAIALIDPQDPETLVFQSLGGHYKRFVEPGHRLSIHTGIMGAAARAKRPILVNDVARDPRHYPTPGAVGIRAELALPILLGDRQLGVLNVESGDAFTDEDAELLRIVADQLAIAVENARLWAETERTLEETRLVYATLSRINTAGDVDEVIAAYLEQVATGGRYSCSVALYEHDASGTHRAAIVRGRWSPDDGGIVLGADRVPLGGGGLAPLLDAGRTVTIPDVRADKRVPLTLRRMRRAAEHPAIALIPLMGRGGRIGLVVLSYPTVHQWRDEALRPYQATAAHLAAALDSRLHQSLLYERGQQIAILEERQRLARELHDSVTQTLFSAALIAESAGPAWRRDPEEGERRALRLVALTQSALAEMRALLEELRPASAAEPVAVAVPSLLVLRQRGLAAALEAHAAERAPDGISVTLDTAGYAPPLPPGHEEALFRIFQEALNNIFKHAGAQNVRVCLSRRKRGATRLCVVDDGRGFVSASDRRSAGGLGQHTMRERAEALGGTLAVRSAPGRGTTVEVLLPPPPRS